MTSRLLAGKVAIVTGGASGIGASVVRLLLQQGAKVAIFDRDEAAAQRVARELAGQGTLRGLALNLADVATLKPAVDGVLEAFGRIDILVNNAGINAGASEIVNLSEEEWDRVYAVNLKAPAFLIKHVGRHMIERGEGRIVNLASSSAFRARMAYVPYAASKAGIVQLTRTAAAEFGPHNINVNAVAPGFTATPMMTGVDVEHVRTPGSPMYNLLGRVSEPGDIAEVVVFLCLPASRQITGQCIQVSAGAIV